MTIQQGDICIEKARIPATARAAGTDVLAKGEATGHAHRLCVPEATEAELLRDGERIFLRVLCGAVAVVHEEHRTVTVSPGEYEVSRVLEYDHFAEEARAVVD